MHILIPVSILIFMVWGLASLFVSSELAMYIIVAGAVILTIWVIGVLLGENDSK